MAIVPWKPFWDIENWFEEEWPELPEFKFPKFPMARIPKMDIYEDNGNVVAEVEIPGVDPKNINVEVENNVLKVEAKVEEKKEIKEKGYYTKELGTRYFRRQVSLPVDVIGEKAEAEYKDGILKISIPKAEPKKVKENKIKVKIK